MELAMTKPISLIGLTLLLEPEDYLKAARLGGLSIPFDTTLIYSPEYPSDMMSPYVKAGILSAIGSSFDQAYPPRYPDDCELSLWHTNVNVEDVEYTFLGHWTGAVQW
jgi:hypothetical protein